ncbi:MAG: hydroxymethylglutaryl-CoA lyase [Chloroflexota bacterium]|nr:hydroxymethylglutaryl-CoA lyase [Chloroflexota bacterium]
MFASLPPRVTIYEVGPRDGLQNEAETVPLEAKVRFIDLLTAAGLPLIEVTSFVRPGAIPQLANAEEVVKEIARAPETRYTALVPNLKGMERAEAARLDGIALFTAASETFSRRNTNASIQETLARFKPVAETARNQGIWLRGYVSTAFGCPYEGDVPIDSVLSVTRDLLDLGVDEVAISDTIGIATPAQVVSVVGALLSEVPVSKLALHFHDTRGTALANVLAGLQLGISTFDSSAGGLGGCPYAPGATGNLATEDLVYLLNGLGLETGVSLAGVVTASTYLAGILGRRPPSRYYRAATA